VALSALTGCAEERTATRAVETPAAAPSAPNDRLVLPTEIEFDLGRATLKNSAKTMATLTELADILRKNPNITRLRIEGHTDDRGSAMANLALSKERANAVAKWLVAHDVERTRLKTVGLGQTRPLVDNDTPEHRAINRRTEFHLEEVDGAPETPVSITAPTSGTTAGRPGA
jgi:outer membrane protein OmpA-like peptidoglycan-associated protein